ncbi:DNRLRE domain-containing protein [Blastococcus sp. PRF04-17]|uniref:DNRLRE domain-containing protein n=1 Tax=Blastococcus sp. PRF04-17 TaxID=2933797 RepID=UPI001FF2280F|nr:DNRLRE domain-containing protein [Blastococcus sp. PRF04-17]UOY03791.1 DNRLRE domain-containing protein [Blastococcus sp. PRF04-17]
MALTPDSGFLHDPATEYPVVVDPAQDFTGMFDTWVQTGTGTDQSGSPELRLGTFDGGATVARSFINLNVAQFAGKKIRNATINLWEFHAWSCNQTTWEVWPTGQASTATRINAQPAWGSTRYAVSNRTTGAAGCADGWVHADVTSLIQTWSNSRSSAVGIGLKAEFENDNYGWKKFNSANAGGGLPTLYVNWNDLPGQPAGRSVSPCYQLCTTAPVLTSSTTPRLTGNTTDSDGGTLRYDYEVWAGDSATPTTRVVTGSANAPSGTTSAWVVPAGKLVNGQTYEWRVRAFDGLEYGPWSNGWVVIKVDTDAPATPAVTSTTFPDDGTWNGTANQAGSFTATLPAIDSTAAGFVYGLDNAPVTTPVTLTSPATSTSANFTVTPTTNGPHVLKVRAKDRAGNESPVAEYHFNVGSAGLMSPVEGSTVVRRVRLDVEAKNTYQYVKFAWRRGPDAATSQDIPLAALTRSNGDPLPGTWTKISDLGSYATWDAGLTLGHVPGPVQVQAVVATGPNGEGAAGTQWVTVTVSPDADHAATDDVGPGSVNLLTGDYLLSSTDVDELGLSVGRTASSRKPRAGLEPQAEFLSDPQRTMSSVTGYAVGYSALAQVTTPWHTGNDALRVRSTTSSNGDSFAGATMTDLRPGAAYRMTGWVYVPAATGLSPNSPRGLRLFAQWTDAAGVIRTAASDAPTKTDMWQQLSLDFTIPADAKVGGKVRLYNGFATAGKDVFYDDVSVREIWSPLGPQWSLGIADEGTGTAYDYISQPYPDVVAVHFAGGGEGWFTKGSNGQWWPQPGLEALTLTSTGTGKWRITETDGTVTDFAVQPGSPNSKVVSTSPPAATGGTRLVYESDEGRLRVARVIAPVETGVDGWPTNTAACTTAPYAAGCEVMQLKYAPSTTATTSSFGAVKGRLSQVVLHSAEAGAPTTADITVAQYAYDSAGRLREVWDPRIQPSLKTTYEYDDDGRVTMLSTPGELPWNFEYGTGGANATVGGDDLVDRSSGRLLRVSRNALKEGTLDQTDGKTTSTLVYNVPLARASGGPYDLDADSFKTWGQTSAPTDATAVFGPEDVPSVTTASETTPGANGYRRAMVHYLDASGREVNTATPSGPDASPAGYIDTAEYDQYGNVVRSLDATNRLVALGAMTLPDLSPQEIGADTVARAEALSTYRTYGPRGLDLLRQRGPLLKLAIGNNPDDLQLVHDVTTYAYDEGKPDGFAYHLVTTQTDALLVPGSEPEQLLDVEVTKNGYDPIDGASPLGPTSGWKRGQPTVVTFDAGEGGVGLQAFVRYDDQGRVVESRRTGSTGASTNRAFYYTAGAQPARPECGNKPVYAGLPCLSDVAGQVEGHDSGRMATNLPVKQVTAYNRYGSIVSVTESATGPVNGETVTQSRTTTTEYDAADRVTSVSMSASGAGTAAAPLLKTVNKYDPTSGDVTVIEAHDAAGAVVSTVSKTFDRLGRMTRYEDGNEGVTTTVFDELGRPKTVTDNAGSTTFHYNRDEEPRGFVTSVTDSVAGTLSAEYGPDGQVEKQTLPGGLELRIGHDANRTPTSRTYVRTSDEEVISSSSAVENSAGQMVTHTTPAASKRYTYDALGGSPTCRTRSTMTPPRARGAVMPMTTGTAVRR